MRRIGLFRQRMRRQSRTGQQRLDARFILLFQRVLHLAQRFAERHQPLRQRKRPPLHDLDEIQSDFLRPADGFEEEFAFRRFRRVQFRFDALEPNRFFLPHHQLDHALAAIRAGALVAILRANSARIQPADGRQSLRAQHSMHRAAPVRQMQRAVARPRRRNLRVGFRRGMQRNAHRVIEPFPHGRAARNAQQAEIIIRSHRNRPADAAGMAARAHFTGKFRKIIRHKARCFHPSYFVQPSLR